MYNFLQLCLLLVFTCGQGEPERVAVVGLKRAVSHGKDAPRHVHGDGEGCCRAEDKGGGSQGHVACVQDDRHAEEDVGEQPAAKRCPIAGEMEKGFINFRCE